MVKRVALDEQAEEAAVVKRVALEEEEALATPALALAPTTGNELATVIIPVAGVVPAASEFDTKGFRVLKGLTHPDGGGVIVNFCYPLRWDKKAKRLLPNLTLFWLINGTPIDHEISLIENSRQIPKYDQRLAEVGGVVLCVCGRSARFQRCSRMPKAKL